MIVTFTANPSIDKTIVLSGPLERGEVQRAVSATEQAAGKGVNVARVVDFAGVRHSAVLAVHDEGFASLLSADGLVTRFPATARALRVRTNTTLTEPDGTTTKVNEPGPTLEASDVAAATETMVAEVRDTKAAWAVLSGSLPPGAPDDWYAQIAQSLKPLGCKVAIDTSDAALDALLAALPQAAFDLIKPNSDELAQLTGGDAAAFEASAKEGDVTEIVTAARTLRDRGIANVMVTLGGSGAVLVNDEGAWYATAPSIKVRSTVGAGDSSVAGFVLADVAGADSAGCLANAVAYGSAAASLPGTTLPRPTDLPPDPATVTRLNEDR